MNRRRMAVAGGIAAFFVGLAAAFAPGIVPLSIDELALPALGVVALVQAFRVVQARRERPPREASTGDPEVAGPTPQPGEDFEVALGQFVRTLSLADRRTYLRRQRVRRGLEAAAVSVLSWYRDYTRDEARERVRSGEWTEDVYAASFLADRTSPPFRSVLRGLFDGGPESDLSIRHTIDAITAHAGIEPSGDADRWNGSRNGTTARRDDRGDDTKPTEGSETTSRNEPHATRHWYGVSALALVGIGAGLIADRPALVLVAAVAIAFGAYARVGTPPSVDLSIDRTIGDDRPEPGDEVAVSVTVRNDGDRVLPDLRIVDGVPDGLWVEEGTARLGAALRPGEEASFAYTIAARRGIHEFDPVRVLARDVAASVEEEWRFEVESTVSCVPRLRPTVGPVALWDEATRFTGRAETAAGGAGVEFYGIREYRSGDPLGRVDWNRRARTGEMATVEFRKERAAVVVLVIDARPQTVVAPEPYGEHALDRAVDAASTLFATLDSTDARVGLAAVGSTSCWLPPGTGTDHRERAQELLATHPSLSSAPVEGDLDPRSWRTQFRRRLPADARIVFVSPLSDAYASWIARYLHAYGYPVTAISPDPTAARTPRQRLARVGRDLAVTDLRGDGIDVIDWSWDDPLEVALARFEGRGST